MLSKKLQDALNEQINAELYSAYLYLSMITYLVAENLVGFAHWMQVQAREEVGHGLKLFDFVHERGGRVTLRPVQGPPSAFESPLGVIRQALEHERQITKRIHKLYELAVSQKDYPTQVMLHWFIDEQVEEERTLEEIIGRMEMAGTQGPALVMIDRMLGERSE
ncbi:MAG: ferritin [Gemmatimonadetes bacterium]|nr:ferritin [Gemmatimonadota bacterium]